MSWTNTHRIIVKNLESEEECIESINASDLSKKSGNGNAPIHLAALANSSFLVEKLIKSGSGVNIGNKNGETPLHWAVQKGHYKTIWCLLESGAMVNWCDIDGNTPLHWAAETEFPSATKLLICAGADVNRRNSQGEMPLDIACNCENIEVIKILVRYGARVTGAIKKFLKQDNIEIIKTILEHTTNDSKLVTSALAYATKYSAASCVLFLKKQVNDEK